MNDDFRLQYNRSGGSDPRGYRVFVDIVSRARTVLAEMGIELDAQSRIAQQLADLESLATMFTPPYVYRDVSPYGHVSIVEGKQLRVIFDYLRGMNEEADFRKLVKVFLLDAQSPWDKSETPGRDAQFELYCAAVCRRAKYMVFRKDPPDFLVTPLVGLAGTLGEVALAVKRVKREGKLWRRLAEGRDQVVNSRQGFIALDLSHLMNAQDRVFRLDHTSDGIAQVARAVDAYVVRHVGPLIRQIQVPRVIGVICYVSLKTEALLGDDIYMPGAIERWTFISVDQQSFRAANDFVNRMAAH